MHRIEPDLSWIEPFVARIKPYIHIRLKDNVLIRMPNECFKLNVTGARLLHYVVNGGSLKKLLKERSYDTDMPVQINEFFTALSLMLGHNLCERFQSNAIKRVPYRLGYIELPVLAELALTDRCNIRCRFCYGSCRCTSRSGVQCASDMVEKTGQPVVNGLVPARPTGADTGELSTADFKKVIDIIRHDAGVPGISFTGGEPMLREDIYELIRYASRNLKMRVNLITNGTLITTGTAEKLKRAGLASAQVSIESPDAGIHDTLTCVPGSHGRSVEGILSLAEAGIHVHPHSTLCGENSRSLRDMPQFAKRLGMERFSMNMLIPVGRGRDENLAIRYGDIERILAPIHDAARESGIEFMWYAPTPMCLFNPVARQWGNKSCAACEGLLAVNPQGCVLPCSSWKEPLGSLLDEGFETVWFGERAARLRAKSAAPAECEGCDEFALCNGACPLYFDVFPEDTKRLTCIKAGIETEDSHGIYVQVTGFSTP